MNTIVNYPDWEINLSSVPSARYLGEDLTNLHYISVSSGRKAPKPVLTLVVGLTGKSDWKFLWQGGEIVKVSFRNIIMPIRKAYKVQDSKSKEDRLWLEIEV